MLEGAYIIFAIEVIEAVAIRSNDLVLANSPTDTDYIAVSGVPTNAAAQTSTNGPVQFTTGQVWNLGPPGFDQPGKCGVGPLLLTSGAPIAFNYNVMNNGHDSQATVDNLLTKAGTALGQKGVQAVLTAIEGALGAQAGAAAAGAASAGAGAATGATLGSVVLPVIGTIVGAVAGWLLSDAFSLIFADCDGLVASEQASQDINQVWLFCNGGTGFTRKTNHPGITSPHGCGGNSNYNVTWSVTCHWLNRSQPVTGIQSVTRLQTHLDLFWINAQGGVRSTWWDQGANNGQWNSSFSIAPNGSSYPFGNVPAIARTPQHLDVFWVAQDNSVWSAWWDSGANNGAWNAPFSIAPANSATSSGVRVVSRVPTHIDVFWVAPDGSVRTAWWDQNANNGAWNSAFNIAVPNSAVPNTLEVVARVPIHLDVFWVGPDGSVRSAWWDNNVNNAGWNAEFSIAAPGSANGGPIAVLARIPTHIDVFWIAPDGSIRSAWWDEAANNGNWNSAFDIAPAGSASGSSKLPVLSAIAAAPSRIDLIWVAGDGSIRNSSWGVNTTNLGPTNWMVPVEIAPAGSAVAQMPTVVSRTPTRLDVIWISGDGSVKTVTRDISAAANAWGPVVVIDGPKENAIGTLSVVARTDTNIEISWIGPGGVIRGASWNKPAGLNLGSWSAPFQTSAD